MFKQLVDASLAVLSVGLAVTLGVGRFFVSINNVAEYISIGCADPVSQKMLIEQVIATGSTLPIDTCTREEMAFIVGDSLMMVAGLVIVLGCVRIGMMISQTEREPATRLGQEM